MGDPAINLWLERYIALASDDENVDYEDDVLRRRLIHGTRSRRNSARQLRLSRRRYYKGMVGAAVVRPGGPRFDGQSQQRFASGSVGGDSFCCCLHSNNIDAINGFESVCKCGEEDTEFDWTWDKNLKTTATCLNEDNREVKFHPEFSCGTAAIRGNKVMSKGQYYWEIKMTTPVYGTDMMIGVGTTEMDLLKYRYTFGSLLGSDCESWALSYTGNLHHEDVTQKYTAKFGQGNIIGIHLDMWHGTLSFYKNRCPLGVAYHGLQGKTLYPMVSSTSARSGMKVVRSRSFESSLQFLCCRKLRQMVPGDKSVLDAVEMPPGLKTFLNHNLNWLLCYKVVENRIPVLKDEVTTKRFFHGEEESSDEDFEMPIKFKRRYCLPLMYVDD